MKTKLSFAPLLLAIALTACEPTPKVVVGGNSILKHITLDGDRVGASAVDGSVAWIDPTGTLEIDGKPVALTPAQRAFALQYRAEAMAVQADAIAVGQAGIGMASKTLGNVAQGLLGGNPDDIGPKVEKDAALIEAKAMQLCRRVGTLQVAQDALARSVPAFAAHATIKGDRTDCAEHSTRTVEVDAQRIEKVQRTVRAAGERAAVSGFEAVVADVDSAVQRVEATVDGIDATVDGIDSAVDSIDTMADDIDAAIPGDGTALIRASARGDLAAVEELIRRGANVNKASRGDGNPLIAAAMHGHSEIVARLVAAGADIDAAVVGDETPLINAARQGHLDIVKLLVAHGADVNLGVRADLGQWRSPLNQARGSAVRDYLIRQGAVAKGES